LKITKVAIQFRTSVYVLLVLIVFVGSDAYQRMPLEAAPDVTIPIILVSTVYPGVAPADMETLVTNVLERELKNLKDVKRMTSSSAESVSVVTIEFESDVDMDDAYQKVRDQVDKARPDLPDEAEEPALAEINISEFPMMLINVFGDYDLVRLKQFAEGLEERLEQINGVLEVEITGGREREIQVRLDPERMEYYKVGVGQVIGSIQREHLNMPGGNIELGDSKYLVRVPGEYRDVSEMEAIVLKTPAGNPVSLRDVGRVVDGFQDRVSQSRVNGKECVTLRVTKRSGENLVRIADDIRALMTELEPTFPAGVSYLIRQDQSKEIRDTVKDLENSVISGLLLVLIVLFFFMGLRNAFFVSIAIPLSMLITVGVLSFQGVTLNMVVLFALIIALGMLVDNSIVVVENIFRHASEGTSRFVAAYEGTKEVSWPIIASTATTVVAFAPLMFWPGIMGEFMGYLPRTIITALLASLFVALVINPVIAASFLTKGKKMFDDSGAVKGRVMRAYHAALSWSVRWPKIVMLMSVALLVGVVMLFAKASPGVEFFPQTTPERVQVTVKAPQGTRLSRTNDLVARVERITGTEDNTGDVVTSVGFSGNMFSSGSSAANSHQAVVDLEFKDRHERTHSTWDTVASLRRQMKRLAGAEYRVELEKMGPPTGAPVAVRLSGPDYDVLYTYARQVRALLEKVPGVVDIKDDFEGGKPEINVEVDREKAMLRKVNTASIAQAIRTAINGTKATVLREGDEEYDVVVRYERDFRSSINDLLDIRVTGKDDVQIPLRDVAGVRTAGGLGSIRHTDQRRTVQVTADVMGRSSSEVVMELEGLVPAEISLPEGYTYAFAGESEEEDKAAAFLSRAFTIGLFLMALILITQFNSVLRPLIILGSIVMSLMGVLLGLVITGNKFSVMMTGMGVISLAGVVVNNAIVLIDYVNQLRDIHGLGLIEAVVRAGVVRFRPVMMTAITTILGMAPMALGVSVDFRTWTIDSGATTSQWWGPMAQAIIFGLGLATLMTLILVPVMYVGIENLTAGAGRLTRRLTGRSAEPEPATGAASDG
jgi:multidrug efflux pump